MKRKQYGDDFFNNLVEGSYRSAKSVLPLVVNLLNPRSVVDLGCGVGVWLKAFKELGVEDILAVEGEYVKNQNTYISKEYYQYHNLELEFLTNKRYDLAVSLEVGEHLSPESAISFVNSLCKLSDVVLFSTAIKGQEGTMHINEQFPEYWAKLFTINNFVPIDYIRPRIWDNNDIEVWYRQNILLYVNKSFLPRLPEALQECQLHTHENFLFRIHPDLYLNILKRKYPIHFANYWWNKFKRSFKEY